MGASAWPPSFGFELSGVLHGTFFLFSAPEVDRAIELEVELGMAGLRRFAQTRAARLAGDARLEGLANGRPFHGDIVFRPGERRITYDLAFTGDDGSAYALRGQTDLWWLGIVEALTLLPASLYDGTGREIGRAMLRFDARHELVALVRSFRLTRGAFRPGSRLGRGSNSAFPEE
jgi:hypothetical protein